VGISEEQYIQRVAEAGLLAEYQEILRVIQEGIALEDTQPKQAAKLFLKAYKMVEATGAVAGARDHPLMGTRGSILNFLGDLSNRGITWS
jgi:hypothetical protein